MSANQPPVRVGFIGAGKMATALASGWCRTGIAVADSILASDLAEGARQHFTSQTGARACTSNVEVAEFGDVLVLAVKPQQLRAVLGEMARPLALGPKRLVVSIAAGIPLSAILEQLGSDQRVVRVMPNTPCLVGESASAYCLGGAANDADAEIVQRMLSAVGLAVRLPEPLLDAVTGLSGSGPAYACLMIEALADGGVKAGLPRDVAQRLAAQTLLGTARMVLETGMHPGALKDAVASPGGTTIAGLHELERTGVRGALMNAVETAARRSRELGQQ